MRLSRATAISVVSLAFIASACVPPVATSPPPGSTGPSSGCGTTTQGPVTDKSATMWAGGSGRRYTFTVPPNHALGTSDPIPLVFDFHGLLEGAVGTHPFATQFSEKAQSEGFAVVFPAGSNNGVNWDVTATEANPDLKFIDALVERLETNLCIDRSRVYITGLSYGGFMTSMLMCMRANTFAAAAPVAGINNSCTPTNRSVPFITFHGTADPILPYPLFADTPQAMADKYGCDGNPAIEALPSDPATRQPIDKLTWECSDAGTAAEFYRIHGGGHSWPGSEFFTWVEGIVGPTASSIDGTDLIWEFFEQHSLDD